MRQYTHMPACENLLKAAAAYCFVWALAEEAVPFCLSETSFLFNKNSAEKQVCLLTYLLNTISSPTGLPTYCPTALPNFF